MQLLAPGLHAIDSATTPAPSVAASTNDPSLTDRVAKLEAEVTTLRESLRRLSAALGEAD